MEQLIRSKIEELRAMLQADGGDLEIVGIQGKAVKLRLKGACCGCPHAAITLKRGIERALQDEVDRSITVESVA
jgi:Fe-S cluster biogenesis protein NfuA